MKTIIGIAATLITSLIIYSATWLSDNLVTKRQSQTQYLELALQINDIQLIAYESMNSMSPEQKRSYNALVAHMSKLKEMRNKVLGL